MRKLLSSLSLVMVFSILCDCALHAAAVTAVTAHNLLAASPFGAAPLALCVNSNGTLTPGIVSMTLLQRLQKKYPPIQAFATDFSKENAKFNETVTARVAVKPAVQTFNRAVGYVPTSSGTVDVPVTINKHKHVSLNFSTEEINGTNRKLADEQMDGAVAALGEAVLSDAFALVTVANFTTTPITETVNNHDRETLTAAREALTGAGAAYPRNGFVRHTAFTKLTNDAKIISGDYVKDDPDYEGGIIKNIAGFRNVFEYADLPTVDNMVGFYCNPAALVIAARTPDDPASLMADMGIPMTGVVKLIDDPKSGLTLMVRYHYNMQMATLQMDVVLFYGVALGVVGHGALAITS